MTAGVTARWRRSMPAMSIISSSPEHPVDRQVEGREAPPIVNSGMMFIATLGNQVIAIDAKFDNLLWRYKRSIPDDLLFVHPTGRGVGLWGDKV